MHSSHIPWGPILALAFKLLAKFGLIPGTMAAYGIRHLYQRWRQKRAMESWPAVEARILWGTVERESTRRVWAHITYTYFVGEYRSGSYIRGFRREEDADEFVRQIKDKKLQIRHDPADPDKSVILDRDIEMIAMLAPQLG